MEKNNILEILKKVKKKKLTPKKAFEKLKHLTFEEIGSAKIDHHRSIRRGFPEVIFCKGKTKLQIEHIAKSMQKTRPFLATRADSEVYKCIKKYIPKVKYNKTARIVYLSTDKRKTGKIAVITAGTADIPVAEEATVVSETFGSEVKRVYDVGVAGLHRLLKYKDILTTSDVIIVIAGMEGALPSVIAGLVDKPVIAVPTSIGYGASFKGVAPLLTMLNSCAPGIGVVNIDNGFGAGYLASLIILRE